MAHLKRQQKKKSLEKTVQEKKGEVIKEDVQKKGEGKYFYVFAGAYRNKNYALKKMQKLIELGYPSYHYIKMTSSNVPLYMVVAGKYKSLKEAAQAGKNISKYGFQYFISK
jgi:cell division protein FtsN